MKKAIFEPAYQSLIASLRAARHKQGLRQEDVATRLGVTRTWVSKIESHEVRLDVIQLIHLTRVYGLQAHRLVKEVEELVRVADDSGT
jgi:transcriptional regulator with XRE-family HTH domain